jgi:hypothetical protein
MAAYGRLFTMRIGVMLMRANTKIPADLIEVVG